MNRIRTNLVVFAFASLAVASTATAQETVTPSDTQLRYNNEGVLKMQDNDYEGAVARFQSSLAVGELNITYLNLGRSLYRLGRCLEASEAFDRVATSPRVPSPSAAEIETALNNFRRDLDELCTAEIVFVCPESARVGVDKSKPRACSGELAWPAAAGSHDAVRHDISVSQSVTLADGESVRVELTPPEETTDVAAGAGDGADSTGGEVSKTAPPVDRGMSSKDIFGWFALGSAAILGTTALVVDFAVVGPTRDRAADADSQTEYDAAVDDLEAQQGLNRIVIGSAIGLGVVGAALLLWPDARDSSTVWLVPSASPDGVGAAAGMRW